MNDWFEGSFLAWYIFKMVKDSSFFPGVLVFCFDLIGCLFFTPGIFLLWSWDASVIYLCLIFLF